jgi:hypothetical protein
MPWIKYRCVSITDDAIFRVSCPPSARSERHPTLRGWSVRPSRRDRVSRAVRS